MKAWLNLRHPIAERTEAFKAGLQRLGYSVELGCTTSPGNQDILISWNRVREGAIAAASFEEAGRPVLIAENSSWGNGFCQDKWLFLNRNLHNTAGLSPIGDDSRWDSLEVDMEPWRTGGIETVILAQRGIGTPPVAMPKTWPEDARSRWGGRIRMHPGNKPHPIALVDDLANCAKAVTWSSGAAISALMMGIPVLSEAPNWVGQQDNTDAGRLQMFRRLAWNQWRLSEFASGEAFAWMLQ